MGDATDVVTVRPLSAVLLCNGDDGDTCVGNGDDGDTCVGNGDDGDTCVGNRDDWDVTSLDLFPEVGAKGILVAFILGRCMDM